MLPLKMIPTGKPALLLLLFFANTGGFLQDRYQNRYIEETRVDLDKGTKLNEIERKFDNYGFVKANDRVSERIFDKRSFRTGTKDATSLRISSDPRLNVRNFNNNRINGYSSDRNNENIGFRSKESLGLTTAERFSVVKERINLAKKQAKNVHSEKSGKRQIKNERRVNHVVAKKDLRAEMSKRRQSTSTERRENIPETHENRVRAMERKNVNSQLLARAARLIEKEIRTDRLSKGLQNMLKMRENRASSNKKAIRTTGLLERRPNLAEMRENSVSSSEKGIRTTGLLERRPNLAERREHRASSSEKEIRTTGLLERRLNLAERRENRATLMEKAIRTKRVLDKRQSTPEILERSKNQLERQENRVRAIKNMPERQENLAKAFDRYIQTDRLSQRRQNPLVKRDNCARTNKRKNPTGSISENIENRAGAVKKMFGTEIFSEIRQNTPEIKLNLNRSFEKDIEKTYDNNRQAYNKRRVSDSTRKIPDKERIIGNRRVDGNRMSSRINSKSNLERYDYQTVNFQRYLERLIIYSSFKTRGSANKMETAEINTNDQWINTINMILVAVLCCQILVSVTNDKKIRFPTLFPTADLFKQKVH